MSSSNSSYYSVQFAGSGLAMGIAPLFAGWLLDIYRPVHINWFFVHVDAFTPLFGISTVLLILATVLLWRIRSDDSAMGAVEYLCMFIQGNPLMALGSMFRYHRAQDESARITTTEQMGGAKNPLNADDLLEALSDPSFNVRYEAIISVARMRANIKLTNELIRILRSREPDLSVVAGWALGRIKDRRAIPALRETLVSEYALLRSRSARSLAIMGDAEIVPVLKEALKTEKHDGILVAYASALAGLHVTEVLDDIMALLRRLTDEKLRDETALAVARMVGEDRHYIRLWRSARADFGTSCSEAVMALKKKIMAGPLANQETGALMEDCAKSMASGDEKKGADLLRQVITHCCMSNIFEVISQKVLKECIERLSEFQEQRKEYILLALNTINAGLVMYKRRMEQRRSMNHEGKTRVLR